MSEPLVTVLTAVRNGLPYLSETIDSIFAQSVTDWEYVIVDDGSDDGTPEFVEDIARRDRRVQLLRRQSSEGPYVAANDGLRIARGRYIARIDADDIAPPQRLEAQLAFLDAHSGLRACGGYFRNVTDSGELRPRVGTIPTSPGVMRWRLCLAGGPIHSTAFVERAAFEEIGGYAPLPLAQDWRLWCDLSRRGWLGILPDVMVHRRVHDERITERSQSQQARFSVEVARDHLEALSGESWDFETMHTLWSVGGGHPAPLGPGIRVLERWTRLWRRDATLSDDELARLGFWTRRIRRRHIRENATQHPVSARVAALSWAVRDKVRLRAYSQRAKRESSGSGSSP